MELTKTERWMLLNQHQMLEILDSENAEYHAKAREVLENGYVYEYSGLIPHIDSDVPEHICVKVHEILNMYQALNYAYEDMADKSGIDPEWLRFNGFSGNDEGKYMSYARHVTKDANSYRILKLQGSDLNSHFPMLDRYCRMQNEWEQSENKYQLTKEDVLRILNRDR